MIVHDWLLPYSEGKLGERAQAPSTVHGPTTMKYAVDGTRGDGGCVGGVGGEGGVNLQMHFLVEEHDPLSYW